jgi:hypothetical protein
LPILVAMAATDRPQEIRRLGLDRGRRRRVARSVRKGQAVGDPFDSPYAVGFADARLEWFSDRGRFRPFYLLVAIVLLLRLIVTWRWHAASLLYPLLGFGFLKLRAPALRRRIAAARDANVELAARLSLPAVRITMPGHAWLGPGSLRRRRVIVALSIVLVALVGLILIATIGIRTPDGRR